MKLYSLGYATISLLEFIKILKEKEINSIADVRSLPYSKRFFEYNREDFAKALKKESIHYVYLGEGLGPRSLALSNYDSDGQVQFEKLKKTYEFKRDVERLQTGLSKGYSIAMMCAEKKPETCHRSLLIGESLLHQYDVDTKHILHNKNIELQSELEHRIMRERGCSVDFFSSENELLKQAMNEQIKEFAYKRPIENQLTPK
jgi:Uncharacterized conserved protein